MPSSVHGQESTLGRAIVQSIQNDGILRSYWKSHGKPYDCPQLLRNVVIFCGRSESDVASARDWCCVCDSSARVEIEGGLQLGCVCGKLTPSGMVNAMLCRLFHNSKSFDGFRFVQHRSCVVCGRSSFGTVIRRCFICLFAHGQYNAILGLWPRSNCWRRLSSVEPIP